jgi:hypothetical protein
VTILENIAKTCRSRKFSKINYVNHFQKLIMQKNIQEIIVQNISHKKVLKSFPKNSNVLNISAEPKIFLKLKNMAMCPIT